MLPMKPLLYRIETYIVPDVNKFPTQKISSLDDGIQLTCQPGVIDENTCEEKRQDPKDTSSLSYGRKCVKSMEYFVRDSDCKSTDIKSMESVISNREIVCDKRPENDDFKYQNDEENVPIHIEEYLDMRKIEYQMLTKSHDSFYPVRQFKRFNSLMSIDERSESSSNADSKISDFCQHGFKNGCTATIPSPEEVSGEIFQENWLRKIEALRQREAAVAEKEINLQNRERQLFNREKEIRIRERSLQDKQRQVEREQKQQDLRNVNKRLQEVGRKLTSEFRESQEKDHSLEGGRNSVVQVNESVKTEKPRNGLQLADSHEKVKELEKKPRDMTRSKNHSSKQSSSNRLNSYSSMKFKERPKESNDDLNSTLSADPGDSSFVKTSELFNPEVYKKPYAFTRSASERWDKQQSHKIVSKVQTVLDTEEKVLRKLTENIHATQDKDTKFQNYGLVDCRLNKVPTAVPKPERNPANEEKCSYLDLATNRKAPEGRQKDRPISWNEKTNEWLQKKRQAYNLATKESLENKENFQCNNVATQRTKSSKKAKNKIFTMFR
ncbi:DNA ligase 1-like [Odontomachus brunneus]|uniref:DNA ligase 1-like n=1 Tax=Odontomachus brunneus TaxID=486640 RepID=UPI0013F21B6D|nr:DNA ligase 1-like [Odontomachus brunneus]XP_032677239.1 DNA ligase 1-like [Odontomachus brunneus]